MNRKIHHVLFAVSLLSLLLMYLDAFSSMVITWWRSDTFAHGFVIVPLALYLIWTLREKLSRLDYEVAWIPLVLIVLVGMIWMSGRLADVLVVEQFAVVTMLSLVVWTIYGWSLFVALSFPLAFLFFAVPAGEVLIPYLIDFTANFTVAAVKLTGIPVFFEGNMISLPSGDWSVVKACSGVRYLMASMTLGVFYAYISYRSNVRRVLFGLVAIVFPILANGLRAFMIVMIGHYSDMKLATGVDHVIYGWLFFGVVMFLMFWLGGIWRESAVVGHDVAKLPRGGNAGPRKTSTYAVFTLLLGLMALWPSWLSYAISEAGQVSAPTMSLPNAMDSWRLGEEKFTDWSPSYQNASNTLVATYQGEDHDRIGVYVVYYQQQDQDAELINAQNTLFQGEMSGWIKLSEQIVKAGVPGDAIQVKEYMLKSRNQQILVWHWYWINQQTYINPFLVKFQEALLKMIGRPSSGAAVFIYKEIDNVSLLREDVVGSFHSFTSSFNKHLNRVLKQK
jgi:exosortase A